MSFLRKIGLGQKRKESAPNIGVKKIKEKKEQEEKKNRYYRFLIILSFLLAILITLPESTFQSVASYNVGEPWRADDLTAPFTFAIQKTDEELRNEREDIREDTPPVFHIETDARAEVSSRLDSLYRAMQPVLDSYLQWQRSEEENLPEAENDSVRFEEIKRLSQVELSEESWNTLLENYANVITSGQPEQRTIVVQIRNQVQNLSNQLLSDGIINRNKSEIEHDAVTVRNLDNQTERTVALENTRDLNQALDFASVRLNRIFITDAANAAVQVFSQVIRPNWIYSESATQQRLEERLANISNTKGAVDQGQIIIRTGDIVTEEKANILRSLAEARAITATNMEKWLRYLGDSIVVIIATIMFVFYLFLYRRSIFDRPSMLLLVFLVLGMVTLSSSLIYPFEDVNEYIVPIAIAPIILTIIFDSRVGLMATVTIAIITGLIHDNNFQYLVATIAACTLGVFSVRDIKKRSQFFFITPGIVFITYLLVLSGFALTRLGGWDALLTDILFVAINAVFILFTYPLILLFEKLFKITTDFTLLELADTNLPLLKKLMNKAPGTFHHSLQVANLAESAASEIGANALLCRVGAMYHDIGKMVKPTYFIENQNKSNEHQKLKPRMSALVIKAHVSEGVKIAEEQNLPSVVVDFIRTHHGTSLIKYFHKKAKEDQAEILDEDFRYDGPIPFTKEQGILMLADGVEASCRSLKDKTYSKIENQINRIIEEHISDGQLSDCPLTFRQIQIIKDSFLGVLKGVYHGRIDYQEEDKKEESESPEETTEKRAEAGAGEE